MTKHGESPKPSLDPPIHLLVIVKSEQLLQENKLPWYLEDFLMMKEESSWQKDDVSYVNKLDTSSETALAKTKGEETKEEEIKGEEIREVEEEGTQEG